MAEFLDGFCLRERLAVRRPGGPKWNRPVRQGGLAQQSTARQGPEARHICLSNSLECPS
jgi:hypothetical protein